MILNYVIDDIKDKNFVDISSCVCNITRTKYITARPSHDELLKIIIPVEHDVSLSQKWICQIFKDLSICGNISDFDEGLLLAVVGCTMNVVYHQIYPDIQPVSRFRTKDFYNEVT